MDRFAQDTICLHHNLEMEHKNAVVQRAHAITVAAVSSVIVIILVFVLSCAPASEMRKINAQHAVEASLLCATVFPHFVFNVLNGKILKSDEHTMPNDSARLTKLIRANLDLSCRLDVTLREEDFVKRYVDGETAGGR